MCCGFFWMQVTGRRVSFEWTLIAGENAGCPRDTLGQHFSVKPANKSSSFTWSLALNNLQQMICWWNLPFCSVVYQSLGDMSLFFLVLPHVRWFLWKTIPVLAPQRFDQGHPREGSRAGEADLLELPRRVDGQMGSKMMDRSDDKGRIEMNWMV